MKKATMDTDDILFLESLANRISHAIYNNTVGPLGLNGSVSPGLLNDDYDRLNKMVKEAKLTDWNERYLRDHS